MASDLSRATLEAVPYDSHSLVEDLDYHLQLVQAGRKIVFVDAHSRARRDADRRPRRLYSTGAMGGRTAQDGHRESAAITRRSDFGKVATARTDARAAADATRVSHYASRRDALMPFVFARIYALFGLALVAFHVVAGILVGGGDWRDFAALLSAPFYVAWKLATLPKTLQSARSVAPWVRTER